MIVNLLLLLSTTVFGREKWFKSFEDDGWTVDNGIYDFFGMQLCKDSDVCYAGNPLTPYGLIYLPEGRNETKDGNYTNTCVRHGLCKEVNGTTYNPGWRIAEGEVIVLTGKTPPESMYWSFTNYIYTRYHEKGWAPPKGVPIADRLVGC